MKDTKIRSNPHWFTSPPRDETVSECHSEEPFGDSQDKLRDEESAFLPSKTLRKADASRGLS